MTTKHPGESAFLAALSQFETCLETPIMPGELLAWLASARTSCEEVGQTLRHEVDVAHKKLHDEIARQDLALAPRIEALKPKDDQLLAQRKDIHRMLEQLYDRAAQLEPHESKLDDDVSQFTDNALHFVLEARKQENAWTTWLTEAFHRDRGVAD